MKRAPNYVLPLVHVPRWTLLALRMGHDRMVGATAYILAHPLSSYKRMASDAIDNYFDAIEALIPQEDA